MDDNLLKTLAKLIGFFGAVSFGVAAKTIIESKKQKIYGKFVLIDLVTAAFVAYLILPYLDRSEFLVNWRGQILAMCGYLGTWMLNVIVKVFKSKAGKIIDSDVKGKEEE